jgi:hypothetical protein
MKRAAASLHYSVKGRKHMKRSITSTALALLLVSLAAPAAFAICTQGGQCNIGGCGGMYQYLYNIDFSETCSPVVWTKNNGGAATIVKQSGQAMCNGFFTSYVQMNENDGNYSRVKQRVTIPSNEIRTHWSAGWNISTTDPNQDAANELYVQFYDLTTGTVLGTSGTYYGDGVDPDCRMDILSLGSRNLAGHTIEVTIVAYIDPQYSNTHFFLTNVQLDATF